MDAIGQLSNYEKIAHYLKWIPQAAAKRRSLIHPIIGILQDQRPWAETYLSKMESDLMILSGSANLDQVASRMENQEQFFDERAALGAAADYKRKGFQVDFIPESTTKGLTSGLSTQ